MIPELEILYNRAYNLFKGKWFERGEPIIVTFARELVDLCNNPILTQEDLKGGIVSVLLDVTSIAGGTSSCLDAVKTLVGARTPGKSTVLLGNNLGIWTLAMSSAVSDGVSKQRPIDANSTANNVCWFRIL